MLYVYSGHIYSPIAIKEKSNIVYEEICNGVYHVLKNKYEELEIEFADSLKVVNDMNNYNKVSIITSQNIYTNFGISD